MDQSMSGLQKASLFGQYKCRVMEFAENKGTAADVWRQIHDWYQSASGRALFVQAFMHETGIKVNLENSSDERIGAAIPKSWGDYTKKVKNDAYYRALVEMFVIEMDYITSRVPRECDEPTAGFAYGNVQRFVRHVLSDSIVLFEHWGARRAAVPGVFGVWKSEFAHLVNFYNGARQTIYGHGSFGLSHSDNHAELAAATIRQAVEIRLRRAFGLIGKEAIRDGAFHPVAISELLEVLEDHRTSVQMPVPLHNLIRINSWSNLLLHSGILTYAWTMPRVLDYLRPLLVGGGEKARGQWTIDGSIRATHSSFGAIREALKKRIESISQPQNCPRFRALLSKVSECEVVLEDDDTTVI